MNIAFFTESYPPQKSGVATAVELEKKELEKLGHRVYIVTPKRDKTDCIDPLVLFLPSLSGAVSKNDQRVALPFFNRIVLFLMDKDIDIVHTHTEFPLGWAAKKWASMHQVPFVHTLHTNWSEYVKTTPAYLHLVLNGKTVRSLYERFLNGCVFVTTPSIKGLEIAKKYKLSNSIIVLPNSVEKKPILITKKNLRTELGLKNDCIVGIFTGRLSGEKRVVELLKAITPVLVKNKKFHIIFVGDGILRQDMEIYCREKELEKQVHFVGFVSNDLISSYLKIADIYLTAAVSEMQGISLVEGLNAQLAMLCRKDSAYTDMVFDEKNGYQCVTDALFAKKLNYLINNEKRLKEFQLYSKKIAYNFRPQSHIRTLIKVYKKAIVMYNAQKTV